MQGFNMVRCIQGAKNAFPAYADVRGGLAGA